MRIFNYIQQRKKSATLGETIATTVKWDEVSFNDSRNLFYLGAKDLNGGC